MSCDIQQFVEAAGGRRRPVLEGLLAAVPHGAGLHRAATASATPASRSPRKEYTDPASVDYSKVEVPNARWHETHTFTCFAFPTYTEEDMQQIAAALVKVIKAYG